MTWCFKIDEGPIVAMIENFRSGLLVPMTSQDKIKKMYLPKNNWYNAYTDEKLGGEKVWSAEIPIYQLPIFIKASAIIPMQSLVQSTKDKPSDTLDIHIYYGKEKNSFVYYENDGSTINYQQNKFCRRSITFDPAKNQILFLKQEGTFVSSLKKVQLVLHGFPATIRQLTITGRQINLQNRHIGLIDMFNNLGELYDKEYIRILKEGEVVGIQKTGIINISENEIEIAF